MNETVIATKINLTTADLATVRAELLRLFCTLAYKEGDFTLSSGQQSSYYINGKLVTLNPHGSLAVGRLLLSLLPENTEAVAGLTLGADPIVSAVGVVSVYENRPIIPLIVRKETKGHGTMAYIEGPALSAGANVVVLEDVVTTGASAMQAVERLRAASYTVDQVISLIDRQQGGAEFYEKQGLKFQAVFTIADLQAYLRSGNPVS